MIPVVGKRNERQMVALNSKKCKVPQEQTNTIVASCGCFIYHYLLPWYQTGRVRIMSVNHSVTPLTLWTKQTHACSVTDTVPGNAWGNSLSLCLSLRIIFSLSLSLSLSLTHTHTCMQICMHTQCMQTRMHVHAHIHQKNIHTHTNTQSLRWLSAAS